VHPEDNDLAYLYATIITDGKDDYSQEITVQRVVYGERAVKYLNSLLILIGHTNFQGY
jgi:hypothetical protein